MAKILIIDDDEDILNFLSTLLKQLGHEVHTLADGSDALKVQRKHAVDLVITDILMPDCDGIEVIRQFRRETPNLKIIAISGGGFTDPRQFLSMAERLGADATFNKPFDWTDLVKKVDELLKPAAS